MTDTPPEQASLSLEDRGDMGTDPWLLLLVTPALAGRAMRTITAGKPSGGASVEEQREWGFASRVLGAPDEHGSRALWAMSTLDGDLAEAWQVGGALMVSDEHITAALDEVWSSLAGT